MKPDARIRVRFLTTAEGGRLSPVRGDKYGCVLMVNEQEGFDCRFVLDGRCNFELGKSFEIAVRFLNPVVALKDVRQGIEISLWEGKVIAKGIVVEVFS